MLANCTSSWITPDSPPQITRIAHVADDHELDQSCARSKVYTCFLTPGTDKHVPFNNACHIISNLPELRHMPTEDSCCHVEVAQLREQIGAAYLLRRLNRRRRRDWRPLHQRPGQALHPCSCLRPPPQLNLDLALQRSKLPLQGSLSKPPTS